MRILNFGSLNIDHVYQLEHIVRPGETISSEKMETYPGGKGLNQSIALARAGAHVYHAGKIGGDGLFLKKLCEENGINTANIGSDIHPTGHAVIQVDADGQNCIILFPGANRCVDKAYADEVLSRFNRGDVLLVQNEISELAYIVERAYEKGMVIVMNPSPFDAHVTACDLSHVSVFLLNEVEGAQITGRSQPGEILDFMREKYPAAKVVLTLGSSGALYSDAHTRIYQDIFKVQAVDTTAAGDTFTGYFMAALFSGKSAEEALLRAAMASALAVGKKGAASSIPFAEAVDAALDKAYRG